MTASNPFDPARDEALGQALRECLTAADESAFLGRFAAALRAEPRRGSLEVLARWANPAVAAAVLLFAAAGLWVTLSLQAEDSGLPEELSAQVLLPASSVADPVLSAMLDGR